MNLNLNQVAFLLDAASTIVVGTVCLIAHDADDAKAKEGTLLPNIEEHFKTDAEIYDREKWRLFLLDIATTAVKLLKEAKQ